MNIWASISLLNAVIGIILGVFVYSINKRGAINRIFAVMCIGLANWGFSEFMLRQSQAAEAAALWVRGNFTWALVPAALLHFSLVFTDNWNMKHRKVLLPAVYAIVPLVAFLELFTDTLSMGHAVRFWGYSYIPNKGSWVYWLFNLWGMGFAFLATGLCWWYWLRLENRKLKRRARLIAIALTIPVITSLISEIIWPAQSVDLPELTTLSFSWLAMIAVYAIWKYELFYIDPSTAAERILETMDDPLWLVDAEGRIVSCNRAVRTSMGFRIEELIGSLISSFFDPDRAFLGSDKENIQFPVQLKNYDLGIRRKDGTFIPTLFSSTPLTDNEGLVAGYVCIAHDISRRRQSMELLAEEKERLTVTLQSIGDGVIAVDTDGKIQLMNRIAESLTGWEQTEAAGRDFMEILNLVNKRTGEPYSVSLSIEEEGVPHGLGKDTVLVNRSGREYFLSNSTAPIKKEDGTVLGYVLAFRDITRRRQMEEEVLRGQKLESIGLLAGGIAHDFNNLLTGVTGNLQLMRMTIGENNSELSGLVEDAGIAAGRAKDLTQQLLTFAKGGTPVKKTADIAGLIQESATFILRGSSVKCCFVIDEKIRPVEIDKGQINQVINNLVINAQQAMPKGGTISIHMENISGNFQKKGIPLPGGDYVCISIEDEGGGIPRKYIGNIFDPYFTTKQNGNGLGLATTFSIIRKHGGYITVDSKLGEGTVFRIYLPASNKKIEETREFTGKFQRGEGTVLIMDDEEIVRSVTGKILEISGYSVLYAEDGGEALRTYRKAMITENRIDVVLMDLTIPGGMGGKEAVTRLLELDPEACAVVGSGYSNDPVMAHFSDYGFKGCVAKPYAVQELAGTIENVIRKARAQTVTENDLHESVRIS